MTPILKGCWLAWSLALLCPIEAWCESPNAPGTDYSVQRRFVQDKYEKSLRLCFQKFAVSDCKQDATAVLNSELSALKNIEAAKMQSVRAQKTQEKIQSLVMKTSVSPRDLSNSEPPKSLMDMKTRESSKTKAAADPISVTVHKSPHEEQAQRKRFEEKQLHAQQHRDAVEKRWMDMKGVKATQTSQTP